MSAMKHQNLTPGKKNKREIISHSTWHWTTAHVSSFFNTVTDLLSLKKKTIIKMTGISGKIELIKWQESAV